jgi:hypothetical protein
MVHMHVFSTHIVYSGLNMYKVTEYKKDALNVITKFKDVNFALYIYDYHC